MIKELIEQNIYALLNPVAVLVAGVIISLLFTRLLPPAEFGVFTTLLAFSVLFAGLSDLGVQNTLIKMAGGSFHSKDGHAGFYVRYLLKWKLAALAVISLPLLAFPREFAQIFLHNGDFAYIMQAAALLAILYSICQFVTFLFIATGRFEYQSLISFVLNGSKVLFPLVIIYLFGPNLFLITLGVLASFLFGAFVSLAIFKVRFKGDMRSSPPKNLAPANSFLFYSTIIALSSYLLLNLDSLLLNYFRGPEELAFFRVSNSIIQLIILLLPLSSTFLLSVLVKMEARKETELQKKLLDRSIKYGLLIAIPISFLIFLTSNRIILFLWPVTYLPAARSLMILSIMIPFMSICSIYSSLLMSKGKMRELTLIMFSTYLLTWLAGAYLVSSYGLSGTAVTFVLSNIFQFVLLIRYSLRMLKMSLNPMHIIKPLLASLITAALIIFLNQTVSNTVLLFLVSGAFFCVIYLPLLDADDKKLANALLSFVKLGPIFR